MSLRDDLIQEVRSLTTGQWAEIPNGTVVPTTDKLTYGNTGIQLNATVLYADIHGSTKMVDQLSPKLAAEYYKAFLLCAGKLIRTEGGTITAYDGDRIMAVFVGAEQSEQAVRTALKLNWTIQDVINPQFLATYGQNHRSLQHTVGIDRGQLLVAKTGVRGENDLVWVGAAANYAAKLNSFDGLDPLFPVRATKQVIDAIGLGAFTFSSTGATVWDGPYTNLDRGPHYRTAGTIGI